MNKYWLFALILLIPFAIAGFGIAGSIRLPFVLGFILNPLFSFSDLIILTAIYPEFVKSKNLEGKKIIKDLIFISIIFHMILISFVLIIASY
jgi:hypothetical protein